MKIFKYFWRETRLVLVIFQVSACATGYPSPKGLMLASEHTKQIESEKLTGEQVFNSYCSGNKQSKRLTLTFSFVEPKNPSGWPINELSSYLKKIRDERSCLLQSSLYKLSLEPDCNTFYGGYVTNLRGENACAVADRQDPIWFFNSERNSSDIEKEIRKFEPRSSSEEPVPVFIRSQNGKIFGAYYFGENSHEIFFASKSLFGKSRNSALLAELDQLMKDFTITEPLTFQKQAYGDNEEENTRTHNGCASQDLYSGDPIGINSDGSLAVSDMVRQRHKIWQRYISRFSTVKESTSTQDPQISNVQVSLDLNGFCRYGRSVKDLTSK